ALDQTSAVGADILVKLEEFDIEARDVQTSDLSLNPIYTRNNTGNEAPLIVGFEASNRVTVRVRDLDRLGAVLGAVTGEGANQMYGLNFGFEDTDAMMDDARRKAVADARAKAELYAEAAGVTLGRVISLSEQGGFRPVPMPVAEMRMAADSVPIAAGESALSASVSMVFEIVQ
ncbi:MAG: SIMPL domain-containing protein, partial [Pseudomonadota bacterium]|nr:SIMPL domain-containing protein [Pseudomonadota bacterium]